MTILSIVSSKRPGLRSLLGGRRSELEDDHGSVSVFATDRLSLKRGAV